MCEKSCYVAVHIGAGYHSPKKEKSYKSVIKQACIEAMERLKLGATANDAVECAIRVLEDTPITNAGFGSNLNRSGQVECDAAIMCSNPDAFGAVGATTAICNPIEAANAIMMANSTGPDPTTGLVSPMFLVGHGADSWAEACSVSTSLNTRHLITEHALNKYSEYMERAFSKNVNEPISDNDDLLQDTVGAVCIDLNGTVAGGVSSGGIALKYPGRVGEAAMFGCGCWAEHRNLPDGSAQLVGCSVSGMGEQIMRTMLAKECAQQDGDIFTALDSCFDTFCHTPSLSMFRQRNAGLIIMRKDLEDGGSAELGVAHTTQSMGYGYMSAGMASPRARISRKKESDKAAIVAIRL